MNKFSRDFFLDYFNPVNTITAKSNLSTSVKNLLEKKLKFLKDGKQKLETISVMQWTILFRIKASNFTKFEREVLLDFIQDMNVLESF